MSESNETKPEPDQLPVSNPNCPEAQIPTCVESESAISAGVFGARLEAIAIKKTVDLPGDDTLSQTPAGYKAAAQFSGSPSIPGYEILGELGRGGMGIVYHAKHRRLNREVALKTVLRADAALITVARFWAEAEVMAEVKHPYVVQVFELGDHAGRPFMAMEFVAGGSLADRLKANSTMLSPVAAELMEKVARGVAAAHELGIVHRDLKPGNVLLATDGTPKVADFGLAKRQANDLTATQAVMGTPAYMAPEQAAGRAKFVGPQADVWALGVMLYECIAGKRPFNGDSAQVLLSQVQSVEPVALRTQVGRVPRDLNTITMKCLAKEPEHRYPSATELAEDLRRFIRGEPIAARPAGNMERLVRWVRRKPTAAAAYAFSTLTVLLAVVVFVVFGFWRESERAKLVAESAEVEAVSAHQRVEELLGVEKGLRSIADNALRGETAAKMEVERQREILARVNHGRTIQTAYQACRNNKFAEATFLLAGTRPDLRGWEYDFVHSLCHADLVTLVGHTGIVWSALWSPDGSKIVTVCDDLTARVWDAATGKTLAELKGHRLVLMAASWSPDGAKIATVSWDGTGRVWDAATGKMLTELKGHTGFLNSAAWSHDGLKIVTTSWDNTARVWDAVSGKTLTELNGHTGAVHSASWSPDGSKIVSASFDNTAKVWDATTGKTLTELNGHTNRIYSAMWSSDGLKVLTASYDKTARVWDAVSGKTLTELKGHTAWVHLASWSPDGSKIVSASFDNTAKMWDATTGVALMELKGHTDTVADASWSADGLKVVTASYDKTARVWDAATGATLVVLKGHTERVNAASWCPDGLKVATASADGSVRVWDAAHEKSFIELKGHKEAVRSASWSPDGSKALTASDDKTARVWDAVTGMTLVELQGHTDGVNSAEWSPDGLKVVTASTDKTARVWNPITGETLTELNGHAKWVYSAVWSPDGSKVVTASGDQTARVWDAVTGKTLIELSQLRSLNGFVAWSPDGSKLVATCDDATVHLWDADSGKMLAELKGHTIGVYYAAWSPNGLKVVTAGGDETVRVWDALTGKLLVELKGHTTGVNSASWSPDSSKIVTAAGDKTARVWDAGTGEALQVLKGHTEDVRSASFSRDMKTVLTGSKDKTVRLWDVQSGAELLSLPGCHSASFNADGTRLITGRLREELTFSRVGGFRERTLLHLVGHKEESAFIYDSRPVNRAFIRFSTAPMPRAK